MNLVEVDFQAWPKTPRLFRECTITEKIDGTNAAVVITEHEAGATPAVPVFAIVGEDDHDREWHVSAQSRKRMIRPSDDNAGFADWVQEHASEIVNFLGVGRHYGEWWGRGIQRGYGMSRRVFSLFNTHKWAWLNGNGEANDIGLRTVPQLYVGPFDTDNVTIALAELDACGSEAAPGFMLPEGVCVWHSASRQIYKALIENDGGHKGDLAADDLGGTRSLALVA